MYFDKALFPNQKLIIAANNAEVSLSQRIDKDLPKSCPVSIRANKAVILMATKSPKKH
jgi:hypothetical protein